LGNGGKHFQMTSSQLQSLISNKIHGNIADTEVIQHNIGGQYQAQLFHTDVITYTQQASLRV